MCAPHVKTVFAPALPHIFLQRRRTPMDSRSALEGTANKFRSHVSLFAKPQWSVPSARTLRSETVARAQSASLGALVFVIVAQLLLVWALWRYAALRTAERWNCFWLSFLSFNVAYWWCWGSDPGIVRTNSCTDPPEVHRVIAEGGGGDECGAPLRRCEECDLIQPMRTKHCDQCGLCIRKHDHHCFWVGGCVGEYNHGRFLVVLVAATVYLWLDIYFLLACFSVTEPTSFVGWIERNALVTILCLCGIGMWLFVAVLLCFHVFLVATNQTTWETASAHRITYLAAARRSAPFNRGVWKNVVGVFFGPRPVEWRFANLSPQSAV